MVAIKKDVCVGVCLNDYSDNQSLIKEAQYLVTKESCPWLVIYIEDDHAQKKDAIKQQRIEMALEKARELGAQIVRFNSSNIVDDIISTAETYNVTHLIIGRRKRGYINGLFFPTLSSKILRRNVSFEVKVITIESDVRYSLIELIRKNWGSYFFCSALIIALTVIIDIFQESLPEYKFNASIYNVSMVYLLVIVFSALKFGSGPAFLAAILSFGFYNYFFIAPFYDFQLNTISDALNFLLFLSASFISLTIASSYKKNMIRLKEREQSASAMHHLSRDIAGIAQRDELINTIGNHLFHILDRHIAIFLLEEKNLNLVFSHPEKPIRAVARRAQTTFRKQEKLRFSEWTLFPISSVKKSIGVLAIRGESNGVSDNLITSLCYQIALSVERIDLLRNSEDIKLVAQKESVRNSLLSSISHDLKTPLVTIIGSLSSIRHMDKSLSHEARQELIKGAITEAERLNQSISNILEITKIESGGLKLKREWVNAMSMWSDVVEHFAMKLEQRTISIKNNKKHISIFVDPILFAKVFQNLIENICKYTPPDSTVSFEISTKGNSVFLRISDNGKGIPNEERKKLFGKFTRSEKLDSQVAGTGLGLAICKAIVELHHGSIELENIKKASGLSVVISLKEFQRTKSEKVSEEN